MTAVKAQSWYGNLNTKGRLKAMVDAPLSKTMLLRQDVWSTYVKLSFKPKEENSFDCFNLLSSALLVLHVEVDTVKAV